MVLYQGSPSKLSLTANKTQHYSTLVTFAALVQVPFMSFIRQNCSYPQCKCHYSFYYEIRLGFFLSLFCSLQKTMQRRGVFSKSHACRVRNCRKKRLYKMILVFCYVVDVMLIIDSSGQPQMVLTAVLSLTLETGKSRKYFIFIRASSDCLSSLVTNSHQTKYLLTSSSVRIWRKNFTLQFHSVKNKLLTKDFILN